MAPFDAELYLRLAGERILLDQTGQNHGWWDSELTVAAGALCAIGAIDDEAAQEIVDDYSLALALRHEGQAHHLAMRRTHRQGPEREVPPLQPRRVVPCDHVVENAAGTIQLRYVSLGDDRTGLAATFRSARSGSRRGNRARMIMLGAGHWGGGGPPQLTVTDDRGTTARTSFSGGGNESEWEGHFEADRPLARDTAWIEIEGERVELAGEQPQVDVSVEALPEEDPALRYLWRRVAATHHVHQGGERLEVAIDALVAAGALAADSPELDDVRAVAAAVQHGQRPRRSARQLPEPWRSLFARGRRADGTIAVGAVSLQFDGISVAVMSLESTPDGFTAEVEIAPGLSGGAPSDTSVGGSTLTWWAADDRGNHYRGQLGSWSGSDTHSEGSIEFWPPLDARATHLRLLPTAQTSRCVITIPLPWASPEGRA